MTPYKKGCISSLKLEVQPMKKRKILYDSNVYTFDIETTSLFIENGRPIMFDYKNPDKFADLEKIAICYIWQFSVNNEVFYGRHLDGFVELLGELDTLNDFKKIIFVHNLAFEFQFLLNILSFKDMIAKSAHKVIQANVDNYNIEFRCTYALTNMSLDMWCQQKKLNVKKLVGNLDYNKLRTPLTKLSQLELDYCENDCLVVFEGLKEYIEKYTHVCKIPITQTGEVRQEIKKRLRKNQKWLQKCRKMTPTSHMYNILKLAFMGGITHANAINVSQIFDDVLSKDLSSSYPTVMVAEKFPLTPFTKVRWEDRWKSEIYSYIAIVVYQNIESSLANTYISKSKCLSIKNGYYDNGRVVKADEVVVCMTNIDIDMIDLSYTYSEKTITDCYVSMNHYLPKEIRKYIIELYSNKTELKGLEEFEPLYMKSKQYINSLYGMSVTDIVRKEWNIDNNGEWYGTEGNTDFELEKYKKSYNNFIPYQVGVWVTAYARRNLWRGVIELDEDVIYYDTDSLKYIGEHEEFFEKYNSEIENKLRKSCIECGLNENAFKPLDRFDIEHTLGIYDTEKGYDKFITLGAKKYCYEQNGELHITVAGVPKKSAKALHSIHDFKDGFIWTEETSNKLGVTYNNHQRKISFDDGYISRETFSIHLMPTTYELGMTEEFQAYVDYLKERGSL